MWPRISSICHNHNHARSSCTTCHRFITRVTRQVPLVEQELLIFLKQISLPPFFIGGLTCSIFSFQCSGMSIVVWRCIPFLLTIVMSVLRIRVSEYFFGVFKFLLKQENIKYVFNAYDSSNIRLSFLCLQCSQFQKRDRWRHESH
jgi:hypothetical protein